MTALGDDATPAAERLRQEYAEALGRAKLGGDARDTPDNFFRRRVITASREAVADLRSTGDYRRHRLPANGGGARLA